MASLTVLALVRSYSVTSSILNTTAGPHSIHTVRFMRKILPLTAQNNVAFLLFASVLRVIFKAPTVSLTSRRVSSLNTGNSLNYLPLTWSSNVWQHSLNRVMCLPIWFSQTGINFLLTGLILTFLPLLTPPPRLCFPVCLQKCRACFSHVMSQTLMLMMMNLMDSLNIPTRLTGPNSLTTLIRMPIWTLRNIFLLLLRSSKLTILTTSMFLLSCPFSNKNPTFLHLLILRRNPLLPQQCLYPFLPGPAHLVCCKFLLHLCLLEFLRGTDVSPVSLMIITCSPLSLQNVLNHRSIPIIPRAAQMSTLPF